MANGRKTGGRIKGTPNKATEAKREGVAEALKVALAGIGPVAIDEMSPAGYLRFCFREAAKAGFPQAAAALAKDAAPYFDARISPVDPTGGADVGVTTIVVRGGLPE